jgi:hypothetical protein
MPKKFIQTPVPFKRHVVEEMTNKCVPFEGIIARNLLTFLFRKVFTDGAEISPHI